MVGFTTLQEKGIKQSGPPVHHSPTGSGSAVLWLPLFLKIAIVATGNAVNGDDIRDQEVSGRVVLQLDGEPVRDAQVVFTGGAGNSFETTSDRDGFFSLVLNGTDTAIEGNRSLPGHFFVGPAYPNPFNPSATIPFHLPQPGMVRLVVYNALGQAVRTLLKEEMAAGPWEVVWNGLDDRGIPVAAGVYLYHLRTDRFSAGGRMMVLDGRKIAASPSGGSKVTGSSSEGLYDIAITGPAIEPLRISETDPLAGDFNPVFEVVPERIDHPDPSGTLIAMTGIPGSTFRMGSERFQGRVPGSRSLG